MCGEVVHAQKEANSSRMLFSNNRCLALTVGASQEQARLGARRSYDNPPLGPAISGNGRRVFHELESEDVDEESDGGIVVMDHDRYKLKKRHRQF
jgi:hypothetical protein